MVNNAGISYLAEVEMTPESIFRRVLEVNLFGTIRVTKKFLPLVKRAQGRVVNMSSMAGNGISLLLFNSMMSSPWGLIIRILQNCSFAIE